MDTYIFHNEKLYAIYRKINYWHSKSGNGFWKFLQPCKHPHYKAGDSWCEELKMSEKTFRKYLNAICERYNSAYQFHKSDNPFNGKPFASYVDISTKKTYYFVNAKIVEKINNLISKTPPRTDKENGDRASKKFPIHFRSTSDPIYKENKKQKTDNIPPISPLEEKSSLQKTKATEVGSLNSLDDVSMKKAECMIDIWNKETKGEIKAPKLTSHFAEKLVKALKEKFQSSLEKWRVFCAQVGSSDFLLGRISRFKAWLVWVIRDDIFEKIQAGAYGVKKAVSNVFEKKIPIDTAAEIETIQTESREGEEGEEKQFRLDLMQKIGVVKYVSWMKLVNLTITPDGEVKVKAANAFMQHRVENLIAQSGCTPRMKAANAPTQREQVTHHQALEFMAA